MQCRRQVSDAYDSGDERKIFTVVMPTGQTWEQMYMNADPNATTHRNNRMVEESMKFLSQPCTVAVGVGHCILEPSMIHYYREKGCVVERVQ